MPTPTHFDGVALASLYDMDVSIGSEYGFGTEITLRVRTGDFPVAEYESHSPAVRQLRILPGPSAPADMDEWRENVWGLFTPFTRVRTPHTLRATHRSLTLEVDCFVRQNRHRSGVPMRSDRTGLHDLDLLIPDPVWRDTTVQTDTTGTAVVGGNHPTNPTVTVEHSGTATVKRRRMTITNVVNRGLSSHPIQIGGDATEGGAFDTSVFGALTPENMLVVVDGIPSPFFVQGIGTVATKVHTSFKAKALQPVVIDIYYGPGLTNAVTAQAWDTRGFDLAHANHGNNIWVWRTAAGTLLGVPVRGMFDLSNSPDVAGAWTLGFFVGAASGFTFEYEPAASSARFKFENGGSFLGDADGIGLVCQLRAGPTNAFTGLTLTDPFAGVYKVRYSRPGDLRPLTAIATTPPYDIDDAIMLQVAPSVPIGVSHLSPGGVVTAIVGASSQPQLTFATAEVPTVTIGAEVDAVNVAGSIDNQTTGDSIVFSGFLMDHADDLVIATASGGYAPTAGPITLMTPSSGIDFTAEGGGFPLQRDSTNVWSTTLADVTITLSWQDRYAI